MQGLTIGGTDYSAQSLNDIKKDIIKWKEFLEVLKSFLEKEINIMENDSFWKNNVQLNFKIYVGSLPKVISAFISDFNLILEDINNEFITKRTVNLLNRIGECANKKYDLASHTFNVDYLWEDYGNPSFEKVEKLYAECSDIFGTLIDASNAASRLEDYMKEEKTVIDNSIHTDNSITIGDGNKIKKSIVGNGNTVESTDKKSSFWEKFGLPLIITIIGGVAVAGICIWLGLK